MYLSLKEYTENTKMEGIHLVDIDKVHASFTPFAMEHRKPFTRERVIPQYEQTAVCGSAVSVTMSRYAQPLLPLVRLPNIVAEVEDPQ